MGDLLIHLQPASHDEIPSEVKEKFTLLLVGIGRVVQMNVPGCFHMPKHSSSMVIKLGFLAI